MGRKLAGPVKINNSSNYYARLTIAPKDRDRAGKTRLIRSLNTSDYSLALRRWGPAIKELENELRQLLAGGSLRSLVESYRDDVGDDVDITPLTLARIIAPTDKDVLPIAAAFVTGKPLEASWQECLECWVKTRNKARARPLAARTIKAAEQAIARAEKVCGPTSLDKKTVRELIAEMEKTLVAVTVRQQLALIMSIIRTSIKQDLLDIQDPFVAVDYQAVTPKTRLRRAYSDDELKLLSGPLLWLCYTGLRPGELATRSKADVDGDMVIVRSNARVDWRPKTLSSERRVPLMDKSWIVNYKSPNGEAQRWCKECRKLFDDRRLTPHSGRHTFVELSRRAGCDPKVVEALIGHTHTVGSRSTALYGTFPDAVLFREAEKIWGLLDSIVGKHRRPS